MGSRGRGAAVVAHFGSSSLSPKTFILHHAIIASAICKFWNKGIHWYYLSFISLLNTIRKNRSGYSEQFLVYLYFISLRKVIPHDYIRECFPSHATASPPYLLSRTWPLWRENNTDCYFRRRVQRANWQSWSWNPSKPAERHWRLDLHLDSSSPHQEGGSHIRYLLCLFFNKPFF